MSPSNNFQQRTVSTAQLHIWTAVSPQQCTVNTVTSQLHIWTAVSPQQCSHGSSYRV
ncbi:hypothetical protein AOLI_G00286030 [Acnodon oligacanthus]